MGSATRTTILILSLGLAACVGIVFYQNHRIAAETVRQNAAIALLQSRCEAAQSENRMLRIQLQKKAATGVAYTSGLPIAARYRGLEKR